MTAAETIEQFFERSEIAYRRLSDTTWGAQLTGEHKHTIGFGIELIADRVRFESFFMRRPMENADAFYGLLLSRNMRSYGVHFAIDADGDVYLVGQRGADGLNEDELDRIVGTILVESDGMFGRAIEIGFADYLAADMAWRARATE
jgi:hypothetical protein